MTTFEQLIDLHGRRALITGATGCLGRVFAHALAQQGAELVLVDRPGSDFQSLTTGLSQWAVRVQTHTCDIESQEQRQQLIDEMNVEKNQLSILINNAAFVGTSDLTGWAVPFEQQSVETWRRALEVNLTAAFHLCQGLAPVLRRSKGANIVNIGSIYGFLGPDWRMYEGTQMSNPVAYAASKGGLIQLTRWLASTLAPDIRINAISPAGIFRNQPESFVKSYEARTPMGRMANEQDFVAALIFLAGDGARYMTGQNLVIDGGFSVW